MITQLILLIKNVLYAVFANLLKRKTQTMQINQNGLNLIKAFEGCKLTSYKDGGGILTIGYGHTGPDVLENQIITQEQADTFLKNNILEFESGVTKLVKSSINENQFSALVSFAYNLGLGALKRSHLLERVNESKFTEAANEFLKWDTDGGKIVKGLTRRRRAEVKLFLS